MKFGKSFLKVCFRDISARDILGNTFFRYNDLSENLLLKLLERSQFKYSRSELRGQLAYLRDESMQYNNIWLRGKTEDSLNVFSVLFTYLSDILVMKGDTVVCRYEKFLHWRMLTLDIQEDLLICAFLADYDSKRNTIGRTLFDWPVVIGHNNTELNMILNKGLAENHFHLNGSAPAFHLTWNFLMNNVIGNKERELLERIDEKRRTVSYGVFSGHGEDTMEVQLLQAAAIRVYLFYRLNEECVSDEIIRYFRLNENLLDIEILKEEVFERIYGLRMAYGYLENGLLRDYAVLEKNNKGAFIVNEEYAANPENSSIYRGERSFLYKAFQAIKECRILSEEEINLFFAYLVIKESLRAEIQQLNFNNVGFENFSIIQQRKSFFTESDDLVHDALQRPLYNGRIKYLEARISPGLTVEQDKELIDLMDHFIERKKDPFGTPVVEKTDQFDLKYAYIFHFTKREDDSLKKVEQAYAGFICRHDNLRKTIWQQATALVELREHFPEQARKVVGIDAASQEIGCRPEVFAPVFRMLRKHSVRIHTSDLERDVPQLGITYHVGEDFLDPLDGLRAIYEAVRFLNLGCGDRLGHALALGIDVQQWYETKGEVTLPCQDYLDNITWLYFAISDFNVKGFDNLRIHILDEFNTLFNQIYKSNMRTDDINKILTEAEEYYSHQDRFNYYYSGNLNFDIYRYHKACMLRGDDPKFYINGYFRHTYPDDYRDEPYSINMEYPENFNDRMISEVALMYYYYHYDWNVKKQGSKYITKTVHHDYISAVEKIQKKMQKVIASKGISIEANPTSNYLIGTFKKYDQHPIIKWYNHSLETNPEKLSECPQLSVSINTDDMGVFTTSLENEFSLMALALERVKDDNNNRIYKKDNVYRWIDEIREFGLMQNFIHQNESPGDNGVRNQDERRVTSEWEF